MNQFRRINWHQLKRQPVAATAGGETFHHCPPLSSCSKKLKRSSSAGINHHYDQAINGPSISSLLIWCPFIYCYSTVYSPLKTAVATSCLLLRLDRSSSTSRESARVSYPSVETGPTISKNPGLCSSFQANRLLLHEEMNWVGGFKRPLNRVLVLCSITSTSKKHHNFKLDAKRFNNLKTLLQFSKELARTSCFWALVLT